MSRRELVGAIHWTSDSGSGDDEVPEFIYCVDGRQLEIHEVCTFEEDGVTRKVHPNARVDVAAFIGECFATNYLAPTWRRIHMFGRNSINGRVKWPGVPNSLKNYEPPWNLNLLAPCANWGDRGSSTSPNWVSGSGENPDGVFISCNQPACVLPVCHQRIFENTRSAVRCAHENLLMENRTYLMQSPSTFRNPIRGHLVNRRDDALDYR